MCRRPTGILQCEKETFPSGEEGSKEGGVLGSGVYLEVRKDMCFMGV